MPLYLFFSIFLQVLLSYSFLSFSLNVFLSVSFLYFSQIASLSIFSIFLYMSLFLLFSSKCFIFFLVSFFSSICISFFLFFLFQRFSSHTHTHTHILSLFLFLSLRHSTCTHSIFLPFFWFNFVLLMSWPLQPFPVRQFVHSNASCLIFIKNWTKNERKNSWNKYCKQVPNETMSLVHRRLLSKC